MRCHRQPHHRVPVLDVQRVQALRAGAGDQQLQLLSLVPQFGGMKEQGACNCSTEQHMCIAITVYIIRLVSASLFHSCILT